MRTPNPYERAALRKMAAFRAKMFPLGSSETISTTPPAPAWLSAPLERALDEALSSAAPVADAFHAAGYPGVNGPADIAHLSLQEVDQVVSTLGVGFALGAAGTGLAAGVLGPLGALIDGPATAILALRAIVHQAVCHGFAVDTPKERAFVLDVLAVAAGPTSSSRREALEHATEIIWPPGTRQKPPSTGGVALRMLGRRVVQSALFGMLSRLSRRAKIISALASAALNGAFVLKAARTAELLYRERFLIRRCGPQAVALCEAGVEIEPGTSFGHHPFAPHGATPMGVS